VEKTEASGEDVQKVASESEKEEALATLRESQDRLRDLIKSGKLFADATKGAGPGPTATKRQARELLTKIRETQEKHLVV
jgi:hypothetical protein